MTDMRDDPLGVVLNEDELPEFCTLQKRLYLVSGASRGGTSLVAYALRQAGVEFGDVIPNIHEPKVTQKEQSKETIKGHISALEGPMIGAKLPIFTFHMKWMDAEYDNACFIYVIRNTLDIAKTIMKRDPQHAFRVEDLQKGLDHAWAYYRQFSQMTQILTRPTFILSHEKILSNPEKFIGLLGSAGLQFDDDKRNATIKGLSTPGYKEIALNPGNGVSQS